MHSHYNFTTVLHRGNVCLFRKEFISERNKYSALLSVFLLLFVLSPAFDTYLDVCCWSRLQEQHVAECLRPITIRGKSFARPTEHFHSIPRFTLSNCYEIHRHTKCACASNAPRIRAADTFICSATNANHLYKAHIYLTRGKWPFCTRGHRHTRALFTSDSLIPLAFPCFITFAITPLSGRPESWNYLYINPPLFSVITAQCYYIPACGTCTRRHACAYTYLARVPSCRALVLLSHSSLWIVRYSSADDHSIQFHHGSERDETRSLIL